MRWFWIAVFVTALAGPAFAGGDGCHDLWFTRNQVMDRAGYCFGSTLGQAVFDNSDCTGKSVTLGADDRALVKQIQALEAQFQCRVDTSQATLDLDDVAIRRQLKDLPIAEEFPGGCLGWLGPETPLHAGHSRATDVIGRILPGDYVGYFHIPEGKWTYVTAADTNWTLKSGGWLKEGPEGTTCKDYAG
ncbi:DUF4453 domain-containing protein [Bauldia sp.]|uniref:DUF4453 domain-containing protein n=1 Tax=Bauldia sp. TaxID=2575872 RepID=UPI003BAA02AA